jgi:hypothetical protein
MRQLTRSDAEGQGAQPAMCAGMAVAAHDQAAGKAKAQFGPDHMDDALAGLIDVEHFDAGGGGFYPQRRQQFLPDLDGASPSARRRDRVIRRCKCQFGIVDVEVSALPLSTAVLYGLLFRPQPSSIKAQLTAGRLEPEPR